MRVARVLATAFALTLPAPAAAQALGHFPEHVDATVQPDGTLSETSSTVPKAAESATITVDPKAGDEPDFFNLVESVMAVKQSRSDKILFCVGLYAAFAQNDEEDMEFKETSPELRFVFLFACLRLALQSRAANADAAATPCPAVPISVPMNFSRTSDGYTVTVDGTAKKPRRKRRPVVVRCRRVEGAMKIKLRPRKRTRSLRSVVGRKLAIGFHNTADSPVRMRTTFNVK